MRAHQSRAWTKTVNDMKRHSDLGRSFARAHKAVPSSQVASVRSRHFQGDRAGPGAGQRLPPSPSQEGTGDEAGVLSLGISEVMLSELGMTSEGQSILIQRCPRLSRK